VNMEVGTAIAAKQQRAEAIADSLPVPDYERNYQVAYGDRDGLVGLIGAISENLDNPGVAAPREIDRLNEEAAALGTGTSRRPLVITNSCAETIHVDEPIEELGVHAIVELSVIRASKLRDPISVQRMGGQFVKPRTHEFQVLADGRTVPSYKGDGINGQDVDDREPDATRLVAGGIQSRELQHYLTLETGEPVYMAHEALSLAYEVPFVRQDPSTGEPYLASAHLPWGGVRTNSADSDQIKLLAGVKNLTGVKIGMSSDERHIADLAETLNPQGLPGKIAFMLRLGAGDEERYPVILNAIREHAEGSLVVYDVHGETKVNKYGEKIRYVGDIEDGIERLAYACGAAGLRLNGVHLETMADARHQECVDYRDQPPTREGSVDPRLNPLQTRRVLDFAAAYINQ